jgi:L-alanine-DL-glutamate epimerase-like enolase superfamily enzyme
MKIVKISLYQYNEPFKLGFHSSQTLRARSESIIVRLEFENGISGYGESTPRTYVTSEDCSTVVQVIKNFFSSILLSHEIHTIDDVEGVLNKLESECLKKNILHYNSALGAIDIALLDALGKLQKVPVTNFLGSIIREKALYSISIPFLPPQKIRELFFQLQKFKFKYVKILLGESESENIKRVSLVRSLFGDHVDIRVEANGKWTFQQAVFNLDKLDKFNITAVEQPVAKDDIAGLQRLKKTIKIPIIVDESMCSLSDAKNLIEKDACDILNIKISKCGGLLRSMEIAHFAKSQNISCQLGAHVGETEILSAAGKSFAFTIPNLIYFEGASFLLHEHSYSNNQFEIKNKREDRVSNFGLGIKLTNQQLIMKHCVPIVELSDKTVHSS